MSAPWVAGGSRPRGRAWAALCVLAALGLPLIVGCVGCAARPGRLAPVAVPMASLPKDTVVIGGRGERVHLQTWRPMFGDTLIGLVPGTGDSTKRFLGRLRTGFTADTFNFFVFGDNRPGWRVQRLQPEYTAIKRGLSANPALIVRGLLAIPAALVKGLYPDLALVRDMHHKILNMPDWGREKEVLSAMMTKIDSMHAHGEEVSAVINTGDLVDDGRIPEHWTRFLQITRPLTTRVPYFAVAGNHERTDTEIGMANWRAATGLPVGGDRMYYCFDSADGWVRFIALDSNPMVDPGNHWTRAAQVKFSEEEIRWLVDRVNEHNGPVLVVMHHPPLSAGFHRSDWERDPMLRERRERMVEALHQSKISIIASGHEHGYERALLTWPDGVLVDIMTGGGGAPLHNIPSTAVAAPMFEAYRVAGATIRPKDVMTARVFNFVLMRLWFGGGEFYTYQVDANSKPILIDRVKIDLQRYGVPKIDQHKMPVAPQKGPKESVAEDVKDHAKAASSDSVSASRRLLSKPAPGKKPARRGR